MVRGRWCQSKNDSADIYNLFQLITSDWVSDFESEKPRETVFNNVWKAGSKSQVKVTKSQIPLHVCFAQKAWVQLLVARDWLYLLDVCMLLERRQQ